MSFRLCGAHFKAVRGKVWSITNMVSSSFSRCWQWCHVYLPEWYFLWYLARKIILILRRHLVWKVSTARAASLLQQSLTYSKTLKTLIFEYSAFCFLLIFVGNLHICLSTVYVCLTFIDAIPISLVLSRSAVTVLLGYVCMFIQRLILLCLAEWPPGKEKPAFPISMIALS